MTARLTIRITDSVPTASDEVMKSHRENDKDYRRIEFTWTSLDPDNVSFSLGNVDERAAFNGYCGGIEAYCQREYPVTDVLASSFSLENELLHETVLVNKTTVALLKLFQEQLRTAVTVGKPPQSGVCH